MREQTKRALVQAIKDNPAAVKAAITGSLARRTGADRFSDLDVLLVARDINSVSDVRAWLPSSVTDKKDKLRCRCLSGSVEPSHQGADNG